MNKNDWLNPWTILYVLVLISGVVLFWPWLIVFGTPILLIRLFVGWIKKRGASDVSSGLS